MIQEKVIVKSIDGKDNACVRTEKFGELMQYRSEMLVIKGNKVLLALNDTEHNPGKKPYSIPGGGFDGDETPIETAVRETREEVRMVVTNCKTYGHRIEILPEPIQWVKDNIPEEYQWRAYYSHIVVGEFLEYYEGDLEERDSLIDRVNFYPISDVIDMLTPYHQSAIEKYLLWRDGE